MRSGAHAPDDAGPGGQYRRAAALVVVRHVVAVTGEIDRERIFLVVGGALVVVEAAGSESTVAAREVQGQQAAPDQSAREHGGLLPDVLRQSARREALADRPRRVQLERQWLVLLLDRRAPALDPQVVDRRDRDAGPLPAACGPRDQEYHVATEPLALPAAGRQVTLGSRAQQRTSYRDPAVLQIPVQHLQQFVAFEYGVPPHRPG